MHWFDSHIPAKVLLCASALLAFIGPTMAADYFGPPSGKGPAVILISGASGTAPYKWYAMDVAKLGYTAILVSGRDICPSTAGGCPTAEKDSAANLRKTILASQVHGRVIPGKVAVIGFSLGGGGALVFAAPVADAVAGVVAYYPSISKLPNTREVAARVAVPTLILAGEKDRYFECCLVESMREFDLAARAASTPTELVVYPSAGHAFNLDGPGSRPDDTADAWERTKAFLARVHPLR